jgi:hypothetical protein
MRLRSSGVAAATLLLFASPVRAQELSLLFVRATSPNVELPAPTGFSLAGTVDARDWLLHLAFVRYTDETLKTGVVCRVYSPRIDCGPEEVQTSTALGGLRLAVMRAVLPGEPVRLGIGGGLSFNALSGSADGRSGRRADFHVPNGGQIGYLALLSLDVSPLASLPVRLRGSYASHWVRFRGCVDPEDPTASVNVPFCGNPRFDELSVGLTWVLPGA